MHGGKAPQNIAAARRREQEAQAERALADRKVWDQNAAPTTDPVMELAALSGRVREAVATLGARLEATDPCPCCGVGEPDPATALALRSLIKESRGILTDMARLGIEERRVRIEEWQGYILLRGMVAAFEAVLPAITEQQKILAMTTATATWNELAEATPGDTVAVVQW